MPSDQLASEFSLAVFTRQIASIEDVKALRRLAVRLHSTIVRQQKLLADNKKALSPEPWF